MQVCVGGGVYTVKGLCLRKLNKSTQEADRKLIVLPQISAVIDLLILK